MHLVERATREIFERSIPNETECEELARAALAETRNPTPEMIEAGVAALRDYMFITKYDAGKIVPVVYGAMHNAMMKEP
jgi:hypothetical protein